MKTKTQLLAERQVLRQLITSVIAASADKDLQPQGADYTLGVCRHFALLFAAGASAPLPAVASGAETSRTARMSSLKELDPHIFLDALVEVGPRSDFFRLLRRFLHTLLVLFRPLQSSGRLYQTVAKDIIFTSREHTATGVALLRWLPCVSGGK